MDNPSLIPALDRYRAVLLTIEEMAGASVPVPFLADLLGVKATTLNARFRRQLIKVCTLGRTNYISSAVAQELAHLHQSALAGWPTLKEASKLTGVQAFTLKAKCEKGQLVCARDLTKRLRINPTELEKLTPNRRPLPVQSIQHRNRDLAIKPRSALPSLEHEEPSSHVPPESTGQTAEKVGGNWFAPLPSTHANQLSEIQVLRPQDYGLLEEAPPVPKAVRKPMTNGKKPSGSELLNYDPGRPFSIAACWVGKSIRYEGYEGTVIAVFDDPFSPRVKVRLPHHPHPLMQEVMLSVGRRKGT